MTSRSPILRALALSLALLVAPAPAAAADEGGFEDGLAAWDLDAARAALPTIPRGPERQAREGILAVYEADYARAESLLTAALASGGLGESSAAAEEARHYLALARGSQRALGEAHTVTSPDGQVVVAFADRKDMLLAPYLFATMARARAVLGAELGVTPDHPVRFEILDDPAKLALVTPLTLDNIYATGTIGITKYRRIVMVSPRVLLMGYPWLDTAVHEYVHYLITLRTRNLAPVWLQEGLAKLLEARWRSPTTPPLDAASRRLLAEALGRGDLVTLAEMSPSIAMLPTQERAALAYAEVETMLSFLRDQRGEAGLTMILDRVRAGESAEDALASAWGADFASFMASWTDHVRRLSAGAAKSRAALKERRFRDGDDPAADASLLGDVFSHLGGGRARQHARLGVLLTLRGHPRAAAIEYERARRADPQARSDPKLARRLGEIYLQLDDPERALPLLEIAAADDPEQANVAAAEGRARLRVGDREGARDALARALRINPFIPSLHCDLAEVSDDEPETTRERALCRE
ncbi:MAG: hypothetical protein KC420_03015 [Myxococcales bacterium]|nr:hypothetical protein [Myxococcales bacterium]